VKVKAKNKQTSYFEIYESLEKNIRMKQAQASLLS
jgi:hypothetical protein